MSAVVRHLVSLPFQDKETVGKVYVKIINLLVTLFYFASMVFIQLHLFIAVFSVIFCQSVIHCIIMTFTAQFYLIV